MIDTLLNDIAAPYADSHGPGAAIAVLRDGQIIAARCCGMADVEGGVAATLHTNYRLASLSKAFTAMAIMRLVEAGKLQLDDPASTFLHDFPTIGGAITMRHLLNHTSGLWDYEDFVPDDHSVQLADRDVLTLLAPVDRLYFAPGAAYRYSNSGYVVLGLIVEAVTGVPFARFLHENIFVPLGMHTTIAYQAGGPDVPQRAWGYTISNTTVQRTDQSPTSATLGDGGIYSSIVDLARWDRALATHALVQPATWHAAITPPLLADGTRGPYGFGWFVDQDRRGRQLWHHGETRGFTNGIVRCLDDRLTVIMLTNRTGGEPWRPAQRIVAAMRGAAHDFRAA